jgi:diguanylate cyclase (GGDEF)-like protein
VLFETRFHSNWIWWWAAAALANAARWFFVNRADKRRLAEGLPPTESPLVTMAAGLYFGAMWASLVVIAEQGGTETDRAIAIVINLAALSMAAVVAASSRRTYFSVLVGSATVLVLNWATAEQVDLTFVALTLTYFAVAAQLHDTAQQMLQRTTTEMLRNQALADQLADALAHRDPLTGLMNRSGLATWVSGARFDGSGERIAVAVGNVDRLSSVNELFGPRRGDQLLVALASRLEEANDGYTAVARVDGDEFAVVQLLDDETVPDDARAVLDRVGADPFSIDGHTLTVSLTTALRVGRHGDLETLITSASAEVRSERAQRGPSLAANSGPLHEQRQLLDELRRGLADGAVQPWFQPIVDSGDRRIVGWEALARWDHPTLGVVMPLRFLGLIDLGHLGDEFTDAMLDRSLAFAASLAAGGRIEAAAVQVNLSVPQARRQGLDTTIATMLELHGVTPSALTVEITEQDVPRLDDQLMGNLQAIEALGVGLAIDDFGTGYSSLSHLLDIRAGELKIDKRFVDALPDDRLSAALVRGVLGMANGMGISTVAEGVETEQQAEFLQRAGCQHLQGYLISPALRAHEAVEFLERAPGSVGAWPARSS